MEYQEKLSIKKAISLISCELVNNLYLNTKFFFIIIDKSPTTVYIYPQLGFPAKKKNRFVKISYFSRKKIAFCALALKAKIFVFLINLQYLTLIFNVGSFKFEDQPRLNLSLATVAS